MREPTFAVSTFVRTTCRPGEGEQTCRYLVGTFDGLFHCAKLAPLIAYTIDGKVADDEMVATGDNCAGRDMDDRL